MSSRRGARIKIELYVASLWLLFLLVILITIEVPVCWGGGCRFIGWGELFRTNLVPTAALVLLIAGAAFVVRFKYIISRDMDLPAKVLRVEDYNYEHLTFLTTYIIPLISFNLTSVRYAIALAVLLFVIGIIYVRTDKFYSNPTLALLGFRLYRVHIEGDLEGVWRVLITRDLIESGSLVSLMEIDSSVAFGLRE